MIIPGIRHQGVWPLVCPDIAEDWHGWLHPDTAKALADRLTDEMSLVVECGTWLGLSARAILRFAPNARLICIDTWEGSPEHHNIQEWSDRLATLYVQCQRNLWPWRDRVAMLRRDSIVGLADVYRAGLQPNLIYLDTKHTLGRVTAELAICLELFPGAYVVGDDFSHGRVREAAEMHAHATGRPLEGLGAAFAFAPWRQV